MNPPYNKAADVPADFVAKEKEIELAKMSDKDKAKPAEILEKIISGKIAKIVNEVTLYGQPYVLNSDQTVEPAREGRRRRRRRLPAPGGRRRHREGAGRLRGRSAEGDAGLIVRFHSSHGKAAGNRGFFVVAPRIARRASPFNAPKREEMKSRAFAAPR